MKVYYETIITNKENGHVSEQQNALERDYCCSMMANENAEWTVGLDAYSEKCQVVFRANGYESAEEIDIFYCPFCGAKIEYEERRRIVRQERKVEKTKIIKETEYDIIEETEL